MFSNHSPRALALAALALMGSQASAGDNLIVNGDFESGNTGFTSDYAYTTSNTSTQQYTITSSPFNWGFGLGFFGDRTTGAGNMMVVDGAESQNQVVWEQTVSVAPSTEYELSAWVASASTPSTNAASLRFFINFNLILPEFAAGGTGQWEKFAGTWNSGSATTARIYIVNTTTTLVGNEFSLDDIAFTPSPGAAGILVIAGGFFSRRRRR